MSSYVREESELCLEKLSPYQLHLGDGTFVIIKTDGVLTYVKIQKFVQEGNKFTPTGWQIRIHASLWYTLSRVMNQHIQDYFIIPKKLFIYVNNGYYCMQEMFMRYNYFHQFTGRKCLLTESQWNILKTKRSEISDLIIHYMFGFFFTNRLIELSKGTECLLQYHESLKNSFCEMVFQYVKENLPPKQWGGDQFYSVMYKMNIFAFSKKFWEKHKQVLDTTNSVEELFYRVYQKFIAL